MEVERMACQRADSTLAQPAVDLERLIRRMCYGDALLLAAGMRLEYIQPAFNPQTGLGGFDYYKLITLRRSYIVHIRGHLVLPKRQRQIAECLVQLGVRPETARLVEWGARTPPEAPRWRLPHLLSPNVRQSLAG
jgi:hypothetical protein